MDTWLGFSINFGRGICIYKKRSGIGWFFLSIVISPLIAFIILWFLASPLSLRPNDLLLHYGICLTIRKGIRYFDLMTSQREDNALMSFKEKWGAQKQPFYFYEKSLTRARPWLWKRAWRLMNTAIGVRLARSLRRA